MTKLIYITHPSVNIDKNVLPQFWDLSEKGFIEAEKLMDEYFWKDVKAIYSSVEPKAYSVARIASDKFKIPHQAFKELGEADRSATPFLPIDEYMQAIKYSYEHPDGNHLGWESHNSMMKRNATKLEEIMKSHHDETIAIIGHGGAGTTVKCFIKSIEPNFAEDPQKTGCYFIADWDKRMIIQDWVKY